MGQEREGSLEERDREALEERERQDKRKAEDNRARQRRQGVISDKSDEEPEEHAPATEE